jgi:phosphoribosyl-ATP pyrophosphohydrolase
MYDLLADVAAFHAKFKHFIAEKLLKVQEVPYQVRKFRMDRIKEEADELLEAIRDGKIHKIAREGVDLIYVTLGTFLIFGIPFMPMWRAVQRANMAKIHTGGLDKPGKPEGWVSPDDEILKLLSMLESQQEEEAQVQREDRVHRIGQTAAQDNAEFMNPLEQEVALGDPAPANELAHSGDGWPDTDDLKAQDQGSESVGTTVS